MDTTKLSSLERRVYGRNLINELTVKAIEKIYPQLQQFVGKKIKTVKGYSTKSFNIDLLELPDNGKNGQGYRSHLRFEYMRLTLFNDVTIKDREYEGGGYGVTYYKNTVDLGIIDPDNGILKKLFELEHILPYYKTVYGAEEQTSLQQQIERLENEVRELKSKLIPNN